jgi:cytochrome c peroxidase
VRRFDDLPARYRDRVDTSDPPLDRRRGDAAALSAPEIEDLIAFLKTLDDEEP